MQIKKSLLHTILYLMSAQAFAQCESSDCDISKQRLKPFEPTYVVHNSGMKDDQNTWRSHYSFLYDVVAKEPKTEDSWFTHSYMFASYTGEFDFYWTTRQSSPVVNRINNPALHWRFFNEEGARLHSWLPGLNNLEWVDIGFEHKSNGQTIDTNSARDREKIELAYQNKDYKFFDTISRTENYLSLETKYITENEKVKIFLKAKLFASYESDITWGTYGNRGLTLRDYDRYRLVLQHDLPVGEWSLQWVFGDKYLATDSMTFDYVISKKHPFFVQLYYGPLYTLSNYSKSETVLGFGYKFIPDF